VNCWIGVVQETGRRVVRLVGRFSLAHVQELLTACGSGDALVLDLTDLLSADTAGIDALRQLQDQGATLVGVPGYIELKLESARGERSDAEVRQRPRLVK